METACVYEQKTVIHELTQGMQMAKQLRVNLNSPEARELLIQKILSSYDKALLVLKSGLSQLPSLPESSVSAESPRSGEFDFDQKIVSKKRKVSGTLTDQVRICTNDGLEGNTEDGYSWRKYGQKDILGAKFPRSYYRCTYRSVQNCLATKQVQRTDEHPTVFEITYKGKHTCNHAAQSAPPPPPSPEKHEPKLTHHHKPPLNPSEALSNLKVNTSDLGGSDPWSFSFLLTPFGFIEDEELLLQGYSPPFISPATSNWGNSPSLDFPDDLEHNFEFNNSFF